jgi:nucleoside-diphosphate-sugar epimerase
VNILVTGATGFIGSQVVRDLVGRGHHVRASVIEGDDTSRVGDVAGAVDWVTLDLLKASRDELVNLCDSVDACVHAAWYVEPGQYVHSTKNIDWVAMSLRMVEALADAGCSRAAFIGTCFEYDHRYGYLSESTPTAPWTLYGTAKRSTSLMAGQLASDRDVSFSWLRLFYQYGPYEYSQRLVPHVIRSLLRGEVAEIGSGAEIRDFLHVADVGSAIAEAVLSDCTGAINIGSGQPISVRDLVSEIAQQLDAEELVRFGARPDSPSNPPFICANNSRLVAEVGWHPRYTLEDGLRETIEWWKTELAGAARDETAAGLRSN